MFHSSVLLALLYFWIALIQIDGGDSPFYLCFLISLKILPYLKYNKRTEILSKEPWLNVCGVDAITWKSTLCSQTWKVHVSAWEWRKMNYAEQADWQTDAAKYVCFVLSNLNTSWWPGEIFNWDQIIVTKKCPIIVWNKKMEFFRLHFILGLQINLSKWQDTGWHIPLKFIRASSWKCCWC